MRRVGVFCGANSGGRAAYTEEARRLGRALAERGLGLVYGGGHVGLMGTLADTVLEAGGAVIGVIPQALVDRELAHPGLSELRVVATMHQRKALMADLSDAFVALPGGYGTADELFEILTWAQLGIHHKPVGLLNVHGFFDPLLAWLDRCVSEGFLKEKHRDLLVNSAKVEGLFKALSRPEPGTEVARWADPGDR